MASHQFAGLFQEPEDSRPPYFDGKHYRHWKARMRAYVLSVDYQSWQIIQNGPLPIPDDADGKKHEDEESDTRTKEYTREQIDVLQANARAQHIINCALSMEEFEHVLHCKTAKESWEKLEIIHEGTKKLKETKIYVLVHEYMLFKMKEDETIKDMFRRFNSIHGDLHALGESYSDDEKVRKILKSLPKLWTPYVTALEEKRDQISYDGLPNILVAFEKQLLQRHGRKKKGLGVMFKNFLHEIEDELDDDEDQEDLAMIIEGMDNIMIRRKQSKRSQFDESSTRSNGMRNNKGLA